MQRSKPDDYIARPVFGPRLRFGELSLRFPGTKKPNKWKHLQPEALDRPRSRGQAIHLRVARHDL